MSICRGYRRVDLATVKYPSLCILNREKDRRVRNSWNNFTFTKKLVTSIEVDFKIHFLIYCKNCFKQYTFLIMVTYCKKKTIVEWFLFDLFIYLFIYLFILFVFFLFDMIFVTLINRMTINNMSFKDIITTLFHFESNV